MSALDIKQADYVQIRDCTTCGREGKTSCTGHKCIISAARWPDWTPKPIPQCTTTSSGDLQPEPSVRHIYICTRFDNIRNAEFCVAERLGNVPLIPQLMYQTYLSGPDEYERETARLASLDLLKNAANELWVMGDSVDDNMRGEIEEALRLEIRIRLIGDAEIMEWDRRREK